ncbi:MAG: hypothetical protein PUC21_02670 [Bacteroidales bacterium]|nr:hypothetical protein [Bacteroidales bacterium]
MYAYLVRNGENKQKSQLFIAYITKSLRRLASSACAFISITLPMVITHHTTNTGLLQAGCRAQKLQKND